jgi:hypothetical protein
MTVSRVLVQPINPTCVLMPDRETIGILVGRFGLLGCIELGRDRLLRAVPLEDLDYCIVSLPEMLKM